MEETESKLNQTWGEKKDKIPWKRIHNHCCKRNCNDLRFFRSHDEIQNLGYGLWDMDLGVGVHGTVIELSQVPWKPDWSDADHQ